MRKCQFFLEFQLEALREIHSQIFLNQKQKQQKRICVTMMVATLFCMLFFFCKISLTLKLGLYAAAVIYFKEFCPIGTIFISLQFCAQKFYVKMNFVVTIKTVYMNFNHTIHREEEVKHTKGDFSLQKRVFVCFYYIAT